MNVWSLVILEKYFVQTYTYDFESPLTMPSGMITIVYTKVNELLVERSRYTRAGSYFGLIVRMTFCDCLMCNDRAHVITTYEKHTSVGDTQSLVVILL